MASKYKINRSNYTKRTRHQLTNDGAIYERDFMTTTNLGGWDSGSIPYGEANFRMFYKNTENIKKRPHAGSWLIPENCGNTGDTAYWTANCVGKSGITEEKQIRIKPNYHSLLDFAYYGSCQELVKSTIKMIIENFPGEINVESTDPVEISGFRFYRVNNPFGVDLYDTKTATGIRDFIKNADKYEIVVGDEHLPIAEVVLNTTDEKVCAHGDVFGIITIYYGDATLSGASASGGSITINRVVYGEELDLFVRKEEGNEGVCDIRVRPKEECYEEFFENIDDFANVLLNRESYPKYTAVLDWPRETDYGIKTSRRSVTWPVEKKGWNLDIETHLYSAYVNKLLSLAEFYDERFTDNLWRMLTHDSVKSMDLAFSNEAKNEDTEDYNIGTTRLEGLLWVYGRQFDDLKRAIKNINSTTNITYNESNNVPDYFLSDSLDLSGWEVYNVTHRLPMTSGNTEFNASWAFVNATGSTGAGVTKRYTADDVNSLFLRELKLNSANIFSKKGTRDGIESILGLFGLVYGEDYEINEHVAVVTDSIDEHLLSDGTGDDHLGLTLVSLNMGKASYRGLFEDTMNYFAGLPFTYVETDEKRYVVPWFENGEKYDGGMYFQAKGGWGKNDGTYDETSKYLIIVKKLNDLRNLPRAKCKKGVVCYIEELDGISYFSTYTYADTSVTGEEYIEFEDGFTASTEATQYFNYFILENEDNFTEIGDNAWKPIIKYAGYEKTVAAVEAIIDDFKANNPHVGYGAYDDGESFLEALKYPFKWLCEQEEKGEDVFNDRAYTCEGLKPEYNNQFTVMNEDVVDNRKVWYFSKMMPDSEITGAETALTASIDYEVFDFDINTATTEATEVTANSIINLKTIDFVFKTENEFVEDFADYIKTSILPYLKQMLPSTAIWTWRVKGKDLVSAEVNDVSDSPLTLNIDGVVYGDNDSSLNDDVIVNYSEGHLIPDNGGE